MKIRVLRVAEYDKTGYFDLKYYLMPKISIYSAISNYEQPKRQVELEKRKAKTKWSATI